MKVTIDPTGRILVPKALRVALGLGPGSEVDISAYGDGLRVTPGGRTARIVRESDGRLVATGDTTLDDEVLFGLIDSGRK